MAPNAQWQQQNQHYLKTALTWLRVHVGYQILQEQQARGKADSLPDSFQRLDAARVQRAAAAMDSAAAAVESPPAFEILRSRFELSTFEHHLLWLCVATELDKNIPHLFAKLYPYQPYPTLALALSVFEQPSWEALSPKRPLRYWQLLNLYQQGGQPLATSTLQADERIVHYAQGLTYTDDRLTGLLVPLELPPEPPPLPLSQQATVDRILHQLATAEDSYPLIQLVGPDAQSQQLVAWSVATALGLHLYRLPVELLPNQAAELEVLVRLWEREQWLLPLVLFLDAQDANGGTTTEATPLQRFLLRSTGLLFLGIREARQRPGRLRRRSPPASRRGGCCQADSGRAAACLDRTPSGSGPREPSHTGRAV